MGKLRLSERFVPAIFFAARCVVLGLTAVPTAIFVYAAIEAYQGRNWLASVNYENRPLNQRIQGAEFFGLFAAVASLLPISMWSLLFRRRK